jgi:hypothetical protein
METKLPLDELKNIPVKQELTVAEKIESMQKALAILHKIDVHLIKIEKGKQNG